MNIETKFNIGDEIYTLFADSIIHRQVLGISVNVDANGKIVSEYGFHPKIFIKIGNLHCFNPSLVKNLTYKSECQCFKSKDELLEYLTNKKIQ